MEALQFQPKIAFIDSGIGGLSIVESAMLQLPYAEYIYFMDNKYLPYGELSDQFLRERLLTIAEYLLTFYQPDVIVVACNTASTLTLSQLRECFSIPFVGVVPAIKPAAEATISGKVVVLATPSTVKNPYTHALIHNFARNTAVELIGSSELVKWAEEHFWHCGSPAPIIVDNVKQFVNMHEHSFHNADQVVLGCTHFPFLKNILSQNLVSTTMLIDSAVAVARQVRAVLCRDIVNGEYAANNGEQSKFKGIKVLHTARLPSSSEPILNARFRKAHVVPVTL